MLLNRLKIFSDTFWRKDYLVISKKLAKEGFEGMNDLDKSKFLSIFGNDDCESLLGNVYLNIPGYYDEEWIDWSSFEG